MSTIPVAKHPTPPSGCLRKKANSRRSRCFIEQIGTDDCRYAKELKHQLNEQKKFAQGYYDEAVKGWTKFRTVEHQLIEIQEIIRKHLLCVTTILEEIEELKSHEGTTDR